MLIFLNLKNSITINPKGNTEKDSLQRQQRILTKKINACQITVIYPGLEGNYDMRALKKKKQMGW